MKQIVKKLWNALFAKEQELRIKVFNIIALAGTIICLMMTCLSIATNMISSVFINLAAGVLSVSILIYSYKTGKYQLCYSITIIFVFFLLFPFLFVSGGGNNGGMPFFFVFAVVYTVYMLEGWWMVLITAAETVLYSGLSVYAFYCPEGIEAFSSPQMSLMDMIAGFLTVSISLGATLYAQLHLYQAQQRELIRAREAAETANHAKSTFLANMSHEIRTPIHVILGMNEIIRRESQLPEVKECSEKVDEASKMLLSLVDNVLDMSKIESGKMELFSDSYETRELTEMLMLVGHTRCKEKGLDFKLEEKGLSPELYGDCVHIKQIAGNLLSNAIKYTKTGYVNVRLWEKPGETPEDVTLCLSVSDTGIGIREEVLPTLFDAFTRGNLAAHRDIEGTGLGLAIVRELTELMHGTVRVDSVYGEGSTFSVELPQKVVDSTAKTDECSEQNFIAPEAHILVVDDRRENCDTMATLLKNTRMQVDTALSGPDCLQMVKKKQYHLILMDYMMPGMDGIETMKKLQEIDDFSVPVIALTANVISGTEEKMLKAGFSAFLPKPVPWNKLKKTLISYLPEELLIEESADGGSGAHTEIPEGLPESLQALGLHLPTALSYFQGDLKQCAATAEIFLKYDQADREKAAVQVRDGNFTELRFTVHTLKGKARNMGFSRLGDTAMQMETLCTEKNVQEIQALAPYLFCLWEKFEQGLEMLAQQAGKDETMSVEAAETPAEILEKLPQLLQQMQRRPSLECLDALLASEPEESGRDILKEIRDAVEAIDFDNAEALFSQYLKRKGAGKHDLS